ncbi:MAG: MFS transporter [Gammaproteobacteria bacterium]|nr:MFS transporter [Gammaproteobacteria bacterium]MBT5155927.1 MFS transporter [Gammaproteobacteria bacterium]MBT5685837.1 MFS transporter [Gammaproteobacteria bacterium]MBT5722487.1 MFS transporter [Gammaproteobacteria bacterium]MBT6583119.1 MFS transporter [Gammaproteobacteria bacterium]
MLSFLVAVGALVFNVMPILLSLIGERKNFSDSQLGDLGSSYFAGFTMITAFAMFWVRRVNWQKTVKASLLCSTLFFAAIPHLDSFGIIALFLFSLGAVMAFLYTPVFTYLGDTDEPDRAIGVSIVLQVGLAALVAFAIPVLIVPYYGFQGSLYFLSLICGFSLLLSRFVPESGRFSFKQAGLRDCLAAIKGAAFAPKLGLLAMFVFYLGITGLWAFVDRIVQAGGLSAEATGSAISVALLLGGLTGLIPALMGQWPSRFIMLLIGSMVIALSMVLLMRPMTVLSVTSALILLNAGWNLTVAYGSANVAESDGSGFLLPLLPATISVAAMLAPALGGRLMEFGGNSLFLGLVTVVLMIAQGLFLYAAHLPDTSRT